MKLVKDTDNNNLDKNKVSDKEAEEAVRTILSWMGEDPKREGLLETPKRVVKAFKEYFQGYNEDAKKVLDKKLEPMICPDWVKKWIQAEEQRQWPPELSN